MKLQTTRIEQITTVFDSDDFDLDLAQFTLTKIAFYLTDSYKLELSFERLDCDANHLIFTLFSFDEMAVMLDLFSPHLNCSGIKRELDGGYSKVTLPDGSSMTTKPSKFS